MLENNGKSKIPSFDNDIILKIIEIIKEVGSWIINKCAQDASETDSVNDDFSINNIEHITLIFAEFKEMVRNRTIKIEESIEKEVEFYLEEIKMLLIEKQEIACRYGIKINHIKKSVDSIVSDMNGIVEYEISRKVSLDNSECREIMKMIPGEKKEQALQNFLDKTIQETLQVYCAKIKECLGSIYEEVNEETIEVIDVIQNRNRELYEQLKNVNDVNYKEEMENAMSRACYYLDVNQVVECLLQEG